MTCNTTYILKISIEQPQVKQLIKMLHWSFNINYAAILRKCEDVYI